MKKFEEVGVVTNIQRPVHHRLARSADYNAIANESVVEDPNQELGPSYGLLWLGLHLDLHHIHIKSSSRNN